MKYILGEFVQTILNEDTNYDPLADGNATHNPYGKQIDQINKLLASFLKNNSNVMTRMDNGKDYLVYEFAAFANIIGRRFCICQLLKDNEPFGPIYVKPFSLFKIKIKN